MPRNVHILNYKFNIGYRDIRKFKETKLTKKLNKIIIPLYSDSEKKIKMFLNCCFHHEEDCLTPENKSS